MAARAELQSGGGPEPVLLNAGAGAPVALPAGFPLADAAFGRAGPDLVLTAAGQPPVVVRGFFAGDSQPTLTTPEGARIAGELAARLAGPLAPAQLASGEMPASPDAIGRVETLSGHAFVVRADGTRVELAVGSRLHAGDVMETGGDGTVGVILADETSMSMGPRGRMVLDEMVYDPGTQEGSMSLSVIKGVYTIVSGLASKTDPDAMVINTPVGSIGIRGTQVGLEIPDGQNLNVVMMREGDGYVGEVFIRNAGGLQVMNQANQMIFVGNADRSPAFISSVDDRAVVGMFGSTLSHLPSVSGRANTYQTQPPPTGPALEEFATEAGATKGEQPIAPAEIARTVAGDYTQPRPAEEAVEAPPPVTVAEAPQAASAAVLARETRPEDQVEVNEAPIAFDFRGTAREDEPFAGRLSAVDPNADNMTFALAEDGLPQHGAVTVNPDGSFTYTPDADFAGVDTFTYLVSDDQGGTSVATANLEIEPVPDVPDLNVAPAAGAEDTVIPLAVSADVPGAEDLSAITISGVPAGATLSLGTDNGDGTWTLAGADLDQLGSLTLTPPANASNDFTLHVTATSTDGGVATADLGVTLGAVADTPSLNVSDQTVDSGGLPTGDRLTGTNAPETLIGGGGNDTLIGQGGADILFGDSSLIGAVTVPVDIQASLADRDGSEGLGVTVSGVPDGASLSAGTDLGGGAWSLASDQLTGLEMTLPDGYQDDFQLQVSALATDTDADTGVVDTASTAGTIDYAFSGGAPGDDLVRGGAGDDVLYGGAGSDDLRGEGDNDLLYGQSGDDVMTGGGGDDVLYGGTGNDVMTGETGADTLYGDEGHDQLSGGGGDDVLYGGAGNDTLLGDANADTLYGGSGDDQLEGGGGADVLEGGIGDDRLEGGAGADVLTGGEGDDALAGGTGTALDSFVFQPGDGHDTVEDYRAGETLRFEGSAFSPDNLTVVQDGTDVRIAFADQPDISVTVNDVDLSRGYEVTPDPGSDSLIVTFRDSA